MALIGMAPLILNLGDKSGAYPNEALILGETLIRGFTVPQLT